METGGGGAELFVMEPLTFGSTSEKQLRSRLSQSTDRRCRGGQDREVEAYIVGTGA